MPCVVDRGFDNGVGQIGDLPNDRFDRLVADDVAIGNAERFAAFEPAERRQHFGVVAHRANFIDDFLDKRRRGDWLAFGHSQQIVGFLISDQKIAEILARSKNLQQVGQGVGIALEEGGRGHRVARRRDEPLQVVDRHVGIGERRRGSSELLTDLRQEIERDAVVGHPREVGVGGRQIGHAERPKPRLGRKGIIETRTKAVDVDHDSA
jgi:hypothetical protein